MKHHLQQGKQGWGLSYEWRWKDSWYSIKATTDSELLPMPAGSMEAFIFEHYYGYSRRSATVTHEYEVAHPSWEHYQVHSYEIVCDFEALYGKAFAFLNLQKPASVYVAEGSPVVIHHKQVLTKPLQ